MSKSIKRNHLINEKNYLLHIPLLILVIYSASPLVILFLNSFKSNTEIMGYPLNFPVIFRFRNYIDVWGAGNYWQAYKNSFTVGLITTIIICIIAGFAAYSLSFFKSSKMGLIAIYFLSATAIPAQIYIVPLYVYFQKLGLTNNLLGIIIIYSAYYLPFSIFLLRSYFLSIPKEICDAAEIDGCSDSQIFWKIILPLAKSGYATLVLILTYWTWNEFFFAVTFLQNAKVQTVSIRYLRFTESHFTNFAYVSTGGVITILPIMLICILLQKRFIAGLTQGGLK